MLQGQVLAVEVASLTDGTGAFKGRLAEVRLLACAFDCQSALLLQRLVSTMHCTALPTSQSCWAHQQLVPGGSAAPCVQVLKQPPNRLQLSREGVGFLKDQFSLAFYNVSGDVQLQLSIRQRGGRK